MDTANMLMLIAGMGAVTYIPRMLPFLLLNDKKLPPFLEGVLKNIPYATLGALIFPGVLIIQEDIWFVIIGAAGAFLLSFIGAYVVFVVIGSICIVSGLNFLFA